MATAKKPAPKKKTTTKKAPVSRAKSASTTPVKKRTLKKNYPKLQSFKQSKETVPFTSFKVTRQTVYWIIIVLFIIFLQLWILQLQLEISELLQVQETELRNDSY